MKGFLRSRLVLTLAALVIIAAAIAIPLASSIGHTHAQGAATAVITPSQGPAGTQVIGTGTNWTSGHQIQVTLENGTVLTTTTVGSDGTFTVPFTIPTNAAQGNLTILFVDATGNLGFFIPVTFIVTSGSPFTLSFTKAAPATVAPKGTIPYTLTLTNTSPAGNEPIHDLHVTDTLPSQLTAITKLTFTVTPMSAASVDCSATAFPTVACTIDNFAIGAVVTITFSALVDPSLTSGTITNNATAVSQTTPVDVMASAVTIIVSPTRGTLFIFIQGVNTTVTQGDITNGKFPSFQQQEKNGHEEGIASDLTDHGFSGAHFLEYNYPIDKAGQDQGKPHPYTCADTFTHSLNQDVRTLNLQIENFLNQPNNQNTDIYLIGHSLGGVIAFGYLAFLETQNWSIPNHPNAHLKGVITLDSPLGGVSDHFNLLFTKAYYILHCPALVPGLSAENARELGNILASPDPTAIQLIKLGLLVAKILTGAKLSFTSLNNLVDIYNTAPDSNPQGGIANITQVVFPNFSGFKPINQLLAFEAFDSHSIAVLTVGNKLDFLFDPSECQIPFQKNFLTTQVVGDGGDNSGVYGRAVKGGTPTCSSPLGIPENHNNVLASLAVEQGILNFLPSGGTPNPLKDASTIL